jgi:hypothetical protein
MSQPSLVLTKLSLRATATPFHVPSDDIADNLQIE